MLDREISLRFSIEKSGSSFQLCAVNALQLSLKEGDKFKTLESKRARKLGMIFCILNCADRSMEKVCYSEHKQMEGIIRF